MNESESEMILKFTKELESLDIEICSRYGDHEQTKEYLEKRK